MCTCSHLKNPTLPIWVVCSESHFTILFAPDQHSGHASCPGDGLPLRLMYYDGLANQEQPITLTLSSKQATDSARQAEGGQQQDHHASALVSPLEYVVHTNWAGVAVEWSGSDPIL